MQVQVLTAHQVRQLAITARAAYEAAEILEDRTCAVLDRVLCALTSDRAIAGYKLAWYVAKNVAQISWMTGVLLFTLGREWINKFVASCLEVPTTEPESTPEPAITDDDDVWAAAVEPVQAIATPPAPKPVLLLPPAQDDLSTKTTHQLRRLAVAQGHKGAGRWNKTRLLEVLTA